MNINAKDDALWISAARSGKSDAGGDLRAAGGRG